MLRPHLPNRRIILVLLLVSMAGSMAAADTGFYVLGRMGLSQVDVSFGDDLFREFDGSSTSVALEAGYRFMPFLAVQGGYHNLGEITGEAFGCVEPGEDCQGGLEPATFTPTGWSLSVMAQTPKLLLVRFYGKLGLLYWKAPVDAGLLGETEFTGTDPLVGVGVRITFLPKLEAILEYETFEMGSGSDRAEGFSQRIQTVSVGLGVRF